MSRYLCPRKWFSRRHPQGALRRIGRPLAVELLETRLAPIVGRTAIPAAIVGDSPGSSLHGVVSLSTGCTGSLLYTGRHILTAAHCVDLPVDTNGDGVREPGDGSLDPLTLAVTFELPNPATSVQDSRDMIIPGIANTTTNVSIPPAWNGNWMANDVAIIRLPALAPLGAQRYDLFRSGNGNEVGQTFTIAGYGNTGTGVDPDGSGPALAGHRPGTNGTKRQGQNQYDSTTQNGTVLTLDFDNAAGEVSPAPGDSGGPSFLENNRIAGITSYGTLLATGNYPQGGNAFGSTAGLTRVSSFAYWIDQTVGLASPLVLDMAFQPGGGDGVADNILIQRNGLNVEVWVNGTLLHSESLNTVTALSVVGSADSETITIAGDIGRPVSVAAGNGTDSLHVNGTTAGDTISLGAGTVQVGWTAVSYTGIQSVVVSASDGSDLETVTSAAINIPITVYGGSGTNEIVGPNATNTWTMTGVNNGTLNTNVTFYSFQHLTGGTGVDNFHFGIGDSLTGTLKGGGSFDTLSYASLTTAATINLQTGTATGVGSFQSIEQVVGGSGADTLIGPNAVTTWNLSGSTSSNVAGVNFTSINHLQGGTQVDTFALANGVNFSGTINGQDGSDTVTYAAHTSGATINLQHYSWIETVIGGSGSDTLVGEVVNTTWTITGTNAGFVAGAPNVNFSSIENLAGAGAADTFLMHYSGSLTGVLHGGDGSDTLSYANKFTAVTVNLQTTTGTGLGGFSSIESLVGSNHSDTLIGSTAPGVNVWNLTGSNAGLFTGMVAMSFSSFENLTGGTGMDWFYVQPGATLSGTMHGGTGSDTLSYASYGSAVTFNLGTATATGLGGIAGFERLEGSTSSLDTLIGLPAPGVNIWQINGNNTGTFSGLIEVDYLGVENLTGAAGNDWFFFANGASMTGVLSGGGGTDRLNYSAYTTGVTVNLKIGSATGVGILAGVMDVTGGQGNDVLVGNTLNNQLDGNSGHDVLIGGTGNDQLTGGTGDDLLIGGTTSYDSNLSALAAILAEWVRTDIGYDAKVDHLKNGGGLNGTVTLVLGSTVHDDAAGDSFAGGDGQDWFWAQLESGVLDTLLLQEADEQVN